MKKIVFLCIIFVNSVGAKIGECCVYHNGSRIKPDYKERRYIQCYCNCPDSHNPQTRCIQCFHFHGPKYALTITDTPTSTSNRSPIAIPLTFEQTLAALAATKKPSS